MGERLAVERAEAVLDALDGVAERDEVDLAEDRGDLDRDVLDVVASQEREVRLEAAAGLALAEDGLAELVQVQPDAGAAALREVAASSASSPGRMSDCVSWRRRLTIGGTTTLGR